MWQNCNKGGGKGRPRANIVWSFLLWGATALINSAVEPKAFVRFGQANWFQV